MLRCFCLFLTLLFAAPAHADDWTSCIAQPAPKFFYVADKGRKLLFQMEERQGQPAAVRQFGCIHGRVEGDKQKEGDLKTPEGVYFITRKITQKLDFMEYGPHAVSLNYPNPADRLRGKTGSGIWLHSKGQPIDGLTTRGCLAIDQHEIREIVHLLKPGTPVIVTEHLAGLPFYGRDSNALPIHASEPAPAEKTPAAVELPQGRTTVFGKLTVEKSGVQNGNVPTASPSSSANAQPSACVHAVDFPIAPTPAYCDVQTVDAPALRKLAESWMECRENHTDDIFKLYDATAWAKANKEAFSRKKKRLHSHFRNQKNFTIDRGSLSVLFGPGYWVTSFTESYRLKDGQYRGLRALYWMKDASGAYRIIGEVSIRQ